MYKYSKDFPIHLIPHITENQEINDVIHNYKRQKKQPAPINENNILSAQLLG